MELPNDIIYGLRNSLPSNGNIFGGADALISETSQKINENGGRSFFFWVGIVLLVLAVFTSCLFVWYFFLRKRYSTEPIEETVEQVEMEVVDE